MSDKKVVIFGGGRIAYRKCQAILPLCMQVSVISMDFVEEFYSLKEKYPSSLELIEDKYHEKYLLDYQISIAATDSGKVNATINQQCDKKRLLCNMVDDGKNSDFIFPSVLRRGDLTISVSTSGKSPGLSKKIKNELAQIYTEDWAEIVDLLGRIREKVLSRPVKEEEKKVLLKESVDRTLVELREIYKHLNETSFRGKFNP